MTQKPEALKILAEQGVTITISQSRIMIDCNSREDAESIFEWLCNLCKFEVIT